ncbi:hypothetical protein BKA56DRAFT_592696 [Ilyonectria sp. MPI-CAGE-AT-0026]|nr:hypothetical protein BKA56DRAFT_592696 [Ilyonectria sp. MPI-CAGE-AT-0026]
MHLGNMFVDEDLTSHALLTGALHHPTPLSNSSPHQDQPLGSSAMPPSERSTAAFRSGFRQESRHRSGHWEKADMMWRFSRLVRLLSTQD